MWNNGKTVNYGNSLRNSRGPTPEVKKPCKNSDAQGSRSRAAKTRKFGDVTQKMRNRFGGKTRSICG